MKQVLKKIRQKPEQVRQQIAVLAAGGVTLLIMVIWGLSLGGVFKGTQSAVADDSSVEPEKPFTLFFNSLSSGIKEQRQMLKETNPLTTPADTESTQLNEETPSETTVLDTETESQIMSDESNPATTTALESTAQTPESSATNLSDQTN